MSNVTGFGARGGTGLGDSITLGTGSGTVRWPAPAWKFGTRPSDDRSGM